MTTCVAASTTAEAVGAGKAAGLLSSVATTLGALTGDSAGACVALAAETGGTTLVAVLAADAGKLAETA